MPFRIRLVTLNTWLGRREVELRRFVRTTCESVDVYCLQEVSLNSELYGQLRTDLATDFRLFEAPAATRVTPECVNTVGNVTAVRSTIRAAVEHVAFLVGDAPVRYEAHDRSAVRTRNMLVVRVKIDQATIDIGNAHGCWSAETRGDTPERTLQTERIVRYFRSIGFPFVLCGDLNLERTSRSYEQLVMNGLRDATAEANIANTRSAVSAVKSGAPDMILYTEGVSVVNVRTHPDVVSDHLAVAADIELTDA